MSSPSSHLAAGPLKSIFAHAEAESAQHSAEHPELDRKVIIVLLTTCVMLTLQNYVFRSGSFEQVPALLRAIGANDLASWIGARTYATQDHQLAQLLFWVMGSITTYAIIPCLVIKLALRERIADY